jgi:hypothetical protein
MPQLGCVVSTDTKVGRTDTSAQLYRAHSLRSGLRLSNLRLGREAAASPISTKVLARPSSSYFASALLAQSRMFDRKQKATYAGQENSNCHGGAARNRRRSAEGFLNES